MVAQALIFEQKNTHVLPFVQYVYIYIYVCVCVLVLDDL